MNPDVVEPSQIPRGIGAQTAERVEREWLVTSAGSTLHHATPTHAQSVALAEHRCRGIQFTCRRTAAFACFPTNDEARTLSRCLRCCKTTGVPAGIGSPYLDPACAEILAKQEGYPR